MRISKRKHNVKQAIGFGRESVLITGYTKIVRIDGGVRLYCDQSRLDHDPPTRFFVDLTDTEIGAIKGAVES